MNTIEPPRSAQQAARPTTKREPAPEPPTGRALWPTFMRRTLDEEVLRESVRKPAKQA